jgi:hypothetical protein
MIRALYSSGIGGDPAGRSSYDRHATLTGWVVSSRSKLEATRKHHGQTKSDQTSIWIGCVSITFPFDLGVDRQAVGDSRLSFQKHIIRTPFRL